MENVAQDPKQDRIEAAFEAVESAGKEQPGPGQAEEVQNTPQVEGGSDPLKTPSTPEAVQEDKGFASHPKWIERENKLKEALRAKAELERRLSETSSFLGSEEALTKHLEKLGFELRKKSAQQNSLFQQIAQKKGWNVDSMDLEQKKQLEDLVDVIDSAAQARFDALMEQKLSPYDKTFKSIQAKETIASDLEGAKSLAERYGVSFEEIVAPKLSAYLDDLDNQDPQYQKKISATDFTRDFLLDYLKEQSKLNSNQEKRDEKRKDAKPVTPQGAPPVLQAKKVVPSYAKDPHGFNKAVDEAMDALGIGN